MEAKTLELYGVKLNSRLLLGTSKYPSLDVMAKSVRAAEAEVVTVSVRREFEPVSRGPGVLAHHPRARRARAAQHRRLLHGQGGGDDGADGARDFRHAWIKLEVIGDRDTLAPDVFGTVEAARILCEDGFEVFPYTTEDLIVCDRLVEAGCKVLMPWGAPIGSGKGLNNPFGLRVLRARYPDTPLIVDAGIGLPSHAAAAMELGYDAVLLNTAVGTAGDPVAMARAFRQAVEAGWAAHRAGPMQPRDLAAPSTPVAGKAALA